jgi:hypothetical protein
MIVKPIVIASICGYVAGVLGFFTARAFYPLERAPVPVASSRPTAPSNSIVRASAFELTDAATGEVLGYWRSDAEKGQVLAFLEKRGEAIELMARDGFRGLVFSRGSGKNRWSQMGLVMDAKIGLSALHLGDNHRQDRLTLGAMDEFDAGPPSPPKEWGLILRGPVGSGDYFRAAAVGEYRSKDVRTSLGILRPDGTYWGAP